MKLSAAQWEGLVEVEARTDCTKARGLLVRGARERVLKVTLDALECRGLIELWEPPGRMPRYVITDEGRTILEEG